MLRTDLVTLSFLVLGCSKPALKPTRDCHALVEHLKKASTAPFGPTDEPRVLAGCATWPQPVFDCLLSAPNDAAIATCESMLKQ